MAGAFPNRRSFALPVLLLSILCLAATGALAGDFDSDSKGDVAVWRPGSGTWFINRSSDGGMTGIQWGSSANSDEPVPGDYDGDGRTDVAVWRPGSGTWFINRSSDGGMTGIQWGSDANSDEPVPGDYDGDGKTDVAVWRPGSGTWFINRSSDGGMTGIQWGSSANNDQPVPGDYDGDGKTDVAVWRPATGTWFINRSSDGGMTGIQWGSNANSDMPLKGRVEGGDLAAIRIRLNQLQAIVDDNNVTAQTLDPFISSDFLEDGESKAAMIDSWTTGGEGPAPGGFFTEVKIVEVLNPSPKTVRVSFVYNHPSGAETAEEIFRREGTAWKFYGNQRIMNLEVNSKVLRETWAPPTAPNTINGIRLNGDDRVGAAAAVQSIVITGPGLPSPAGITMNRQAGESYFIPLPVLPYNIFNIPSDNVIGAIPDNAAYTFTLYDQLNGSGIALYVYSINNPKRPYLWSEIADSLFPQMISPTSHALSAANPGGTLYAITTKPAGHSADWANLNFLNPAGGGWWRDVNGNSTSTYVFDSAGMGFTPMEGSLLINTKDIMTSRESAIVWHFNAPAFPNSIQLPTNSSHLYLRENTDGTKGYWHDIPVRNADGSLLTDSALIQDFRCFAYPAMTPIPPAAPWYLFQSPFQYSDSDGGQPNPPVLSAYSAIEGYLNVPMGTMTTGFTLCVVTDNTGQQQTSWLYHTPPTEVPKVLSSSMGMVDNGNGTVTLSWTPPASPPLDPAKHYLRLFILSSVDYSGDGYDDLLLVSSLSGTASSYTIPAQEVARLKDFTSLYWYVQSRERATDITPPVGTARGYWTYRNNGQTQSLTLPGTGAFSQSDLTGGWDVIMFRTGDGAGWLHGAATVNSTGEVTVTSALDSDGDATFPPPGSFTWTISGAGGVLERGPYGNLSFRGQMSSNKQLVIGKDDGSAANSAGLRVFRKRTGTAFSNADLASKTFTFHGLLSGIDNNWVYGEGSTDGSGLMTITSVVIPSGPQPPEAGGTLSVNSAGIVTESGRPTWYGIMTDDKKMIFSVDTGDNPNAYSFVVVTLSGQTYAQSDLAGTYNFSSIRNNSPNPGWGYGTFSVDASGNGAYLSYFDSAGGPLPSPFTRALSASGVVTDPADATHHGQMSYNKDLWVRTNTNAAGRYGLAISVK